MTKHKLSIAISALALLAVVISATTSEVHAAEAARASVAEQSSAVSESSSLAFLVVVLQRQYVQIIVVGSEQETPESALLTERSLHLLD